MHRKNIIYSGQQLAKAEKVLIMIHGRGGSAEDILSLSDHLVAGDFALLAPQATENTWYPYSFLAPVEQNEPWLSSALSLVGEAVSDVIAAGIKKENIFFLGFSQGACLTLEFTARNAARYGGIIAFTGGLIGSSIHRANYKGNFEGTPVFIGSSDPDMHVPVDRVHATTSVLQLMGAEVTEKIYKGMGHTINADEIQHANKILERK